MSDHITMLAKILAAFVVASVLTLAAFGIGVSVGMHSLDGEALAPALSLTPTEPRRPAQETAQPSEQESSLDLGLFQEVWRLLQEQFYGELPQGREVTYEVIRGFLERLGDPHTVFVDPKHAALFNEDLEGHFEGIGARVDEAEGGGVLLKYLFPDQPAEKAGLKVGDVIIAVDEQDITKLTLLEAINMIRGPRGSTVVLTIRRGNQEPFDVAVVRARIEIPVVETNTLAEGRIAYVALSEFSAVAPLRLAEALRTALAKKPSGLILDLRGNPGGLLDAAVKIGSYFVPQGDILIERFRDGREKRYKREGLYLLGSTPLVVLVDGGSASASEIVAGAIQDAGTGILIGEKTFGKGSVQLSNTLSDGSQLRVTVALWFTPKNRGIQGAGLEPDIAVPLSEEDVAARRDPQLERAVEYLLGRQAERPADKD